jgi:hypothetical protein
LKNLGILVSLVAARRAPEDPLTRKLRGFANLPAGWSHGEGVPVNADVIRVAVAFVEAANQLQLKADVFPGIHGECAVAFYQGGRSVEVVISPDRLSEFGLHVEEGSGFDFQTILRQDDASYSDVLNQLIQLATEAWKSPASSRFVSSTQTRAAFRTSSSSTRPGSLLELQTAS